MSTNDPIARRFVTLDGRRVSYLWRDGGHDGPTLLFIHGSGMSARYWSDQLRALADTARVLAVDLPGHGESDDAPTPSLARYPDVTAGVIDAVVASSRSRAATGAAAARRGPGLILCGSRDRVTPPALSRPLHATIAGSRLDLVDGAGHMLLIEASGVVNRAIAAFAASITRRPAARAHAGAAARSASRWRRAPRRPVAPVRRR